MEYDLRNVTTEEIPSLIEAKLQLVEEAEKKEIEANKLAKSAYKNAQDASTISVGYLHGKVEAIEGLQKTTVDIAQAVIANTEAQEKTQELQKRLTEFVEFLFKLSVSSIEANEKTVEKLKEVVSSRKNNPEKSQTCLQISKLIKDLNDQRSIMYKLDTFSKNLKEQKKQLDKVEEEVNTFMTMDVNGFSMKGIEEKFDAIVGKMKEFNETLLKNNQELTDMFSDLNNRVSDKLFNLSLNMNNLQSEYKELIDQQNLMLDHSLNDINESIQNENELSKLKFSEISEQFKDISKQREIDRKKLRRTNIKFYVFISFCLAFIIAIFFIVIFKK